MKPLLACLVTLTALVAQAAPALAQTQKGSDLQSAPNVTFGCELMPSEELFGFAMVPHGFPTCSWWSTGSAGVTPDPRSSQVPSTGTVTNVRIRAGANPAPVRVVINRITRGPSGAFCCEGVATSDVLALQPNQVNAFTVNLPVQSVRDYAQGIAWFDYVGISAASGSGNLPIHDQAAEFGPDAHAPQSAFTPAIITSAMTAPELLPTDGLRITERGGIGFEVLMQYDHVACPTAPNGQPLKRAAQDGPIAHAAQAGCAAPAGPVVPPGGGDGVAPPPPPPPPPPPAAAQFLGGAALRARANRLSVPVRCDLTVACRGLLRVLTRGAKPRTLGQLRASVPAGQTRTLKPRLNAKGRRLVRRGRRVPAKVELDLGTGGVFTRDVTLRR